MKSIFTLTLFFIFTQFVHAVGNDVVDDIAVLQRVGFNFTKSQFSSTEETIHFTVKIPPHYISGYGKKTFARAAYFKPEEADAKGPQLISSNGLRLPLDHRNEATGHSLTISILAGEVTGTYLEFTFNQGSGHPPMLVHVPLKAVTDFLAKPARDEDVAAQSAPTDADPKTKNEERPKSGEDSQ